MAKKTVRVGDVDVTLKTFKTNLFFLKEIGADVRLIPVDKKLKRLWAIANGFFAGGLPFQNPKRAEIELEERFGPISIELEARFFGKPEGFPNPPEIEATPLTKNCSSMFCRARHRAFGLFVDIKGNGDVGGASPVPLPLTRVQAHARVVFRGETVEIDVT